MSADSPELTLGQDFLTWLWYRGENANGLFRIHASNAAYNVSMEQRVVVRGGDGENIETASVSGVVSLLREARMGLAIGKKVVRALVRLEKDGLDFSLTLKAEDFALNSLRTPSVMRSDSPDNDPDAGFLEKMYLLESCLELVDDLYRHFLDLRLSPKAWQEEAMAIGKWINSTSAI
jgi:hypothetical protein